jgi:hypothetical protein
MNNPPHGIELNTSITIFVELKMALYEPKHIVNFLESGDKLYVWINVSLLNNTKVKGKGSKVVPVLN